MICSLDVTSRIYDLCVTFFVGKLILRKRYTGLVICWVVIADSMKVLWLVMVAQAGSGSVATSIAAMLN